MAKKLEKQFKIMAPGGQATPAPPLGPALGAAGVNPGQFIQVFNDRTKELNGKVVGCIVSVFNDRSFDLEIKSSPALASTSRTITMMPPAPARAKHLSMSITGTATTSGDITTTSPSSKMTRQRAASTPFSPLPSAPHTMVSYRTMP